MSSLMMALAVNAIQKGNLKSMPLLAAHDDFLRLHLPRLPGVRVQQLRVREAHDDLEQHSRHDVLHAHRHARHARRHRRALAQPDVCPLVQAAIGRSSVVRHHPARRGAGRRHPAFHEAGAVAGLGLPATASAPVARHFAKRSSSPSSGPSSRSAPCAGSPVPPARCSSTSTTPIDVESMGLYWHFVDIVWIVIFTAVYLLEYL